MSDRRPLIYLGIFAALALGYYFYEHKGGIERSEREEQQKKALQFSPDSAAAFRIISRTDSAGQKPDTLRLERGADGWLLARPIQAEADSEAVARLLRSAAGASRNRVVVDSAADLSIFGLDSPQLSFAVTTADGGEQALHLGSKNPGDTYIYALNPEQPQRVVLLNSWLLGDLDRTVFQLRDKSLLEFDKDEVDRLVVRRPGAENLELVRGGGRWRMESPEAMIAELDSVDAIIEKLAGAEAEGFVDTLPEEGAAVYGLDQPVMSVEIRGGGGALYGLVFGSRDVDGSYYAARLGAEDKIFLAGADLFDLLAGDPARLRDMALVGVDRDSVTSVSYSGDSGSWTAERDSAGDWSFAEPSGVRLDKAGLDNFLWDLRDLRARAFIARPPAAVQRALDSPAFTVSFSANGDTGRVSFAPAEGDTLYCASSNAFPGVALVDSSAAAKLNQSLHSMQDRKVVDFETSGADRVRIERSGQPAIELAGEGGEWEVTTPREQDAAGWKVQNLFWDLIDIEFERVLGESASDSSAFGFDSPVAAVSIWQGDSLVARVALGDSLAGEASALVALRTLGDGRTFAVDAGILAEIPDSIEDLAEN
ncbi:MAG: DUF4340 domain-containing protein [Candidatus Glassbacteria bacterium]|nr:DUF4340 domain-containing protein [Candidatus Glassbacteria bacterium]